MLNDPSLFLNAVPMRFQYRFSPRSTMLNAAQGLRPPAPTVEDCCWFSIPSLPCAAQCGACRGGAKQPACQTLFALRNGRGIPKQDAQNGPRDSFWVFAKKIIIFFAEPARRLRVAATGVQTRRPPATPRGPQL